MYGVSAGPISYIYVADILPDIGVGIAMSVMWICYMSMAYLFPLAKDVFGIISCFIFFVVVSFIGVIFMVFIVKETKGKS